MFCTCSCGSEATGSFLLCHDLDDDLQLIGNLMWARLRFTRYSPSLSLSPWLSHAYTYSLALSPPPPSPSRVARQAAASPRLGINNSSGDRLLPSRCRNILFPRWLAAYRGREEEEEEDGRVHRGGDAQIIKRKSPPSASAVWHSIMRWESAS